jgi:hypothetical protein
MEKLRRKKPKIEGQMVQMPLSREERVAVVNAGRIVRRWPVQ